VTGKPCEWPVCLTDAEHDRLLAEIQATEDDRPMTPASDKRKTCRCVESEVLTEEDLPWWLGINPAGG
jgi:hypothetical protein